MRKGNNWMKRIRTIITVVFSVSHSQLWICSHQYHYNRSFLAHSSWHRSWDQHNHGSPDYCHQHGIWAAPPHTNKGKKNSLDRKLLKRLLKNAIKMLEWSFWQLMTSGAGSEGRTTTTWLTLASWPLGVQLRCSECMMGQHKGTWCFAFFSLFFGGAHKGGRQKRVECPSPSMDLLRRECEKRARADGWLF